LSENQAVQSILSIFREQMPSIDKVTSDEAKHQGDVTSIALHDGLLYSAGSDGKVKVGKPIELKIVESFLSFSSCCRFGMPT
jgi:hypothetical protein